MTKMSFIVIAVIALLVCVEANKEEDGSIEARGKGKYALLTNLAIMFAVKVGLYKIFVGIALIIASMKALVVMAWALAISKYVPDVWPHYKQASFAHSHYGDIVSKIGRKPEYPYTQSNMDWLLSFFRRQVHFFYVAATKLFILKIVYGIIFFALITKGWHFVLWFIHYIKQKKEHVQYIEPEPVHHGYHDHEYGQHGYEHEYEAPYHGYDDRPYDGYGKTPYDEYPSDKKRVYDADGSYSVKNTRLA